VHHTFYLSSSLQQAWDPTQRNPTQPNHYTATHRSATIPREFGVQLLTTLPLAYICVCTYFALFRINAFDYNKLLPRCGVLGREGLACVGIGVGWGWDWFGWVWLWLLLVLVVVVGLLIIIDCVNPALTLTANPNPTNPQPRINPPPTPRRATTGAALMQNGSLMCRFAPATCWNLLHMVHMDGRVDDQKTVFTKNMGSMDVLPVFGKHLNVGGWGWGGLDWGGALMCLCCW